MVPRSAAWSWAGMVAESESCPLDFRLFVVAAMRDKSWPSNLVLGCCNKFGPNRIGSDRFIISDLSYPLGGCLVGGVRCEILLSLLLSIFISPLSRGCWLRRCEPSGDPEAISSRGARTLVVSRSLRKNIFANDNTKEENTPRMQQCLDSKINVVSCPMCYIDGYYASSIANCT
ncbi:uncharacterized protein LOC122042271 [Zingiber officinale]|uniref:uncharacterized protein LOC122042271 n=1 Tax=Zingiber officinale TaxID=94328 RepID=UPI001C4B7D3E|nr:uncharacterized protein LOC122042271 [Zingiber officinale]